MIPFMLDVTDKPVVIVGGGEVATRRVHKLLDAGAQVTVIAPELSAQLEAWEAAGEITAHRRGVRKEDLVPAWLVMEHTGSAAVQKMVEATCLQHRIWCLLGGNPADSTFWNMATAHHGDLTVAVSAHGNPRRAKQAAETLIKHARQQDL
ncbi:bifunctional precorrin-2 dehydrogenase/sirohydrochlorin ferrochelatase [Rothia sp. LK2588]|uniref:bifunctional precorrin-2 dehydrogenase/sirohydrochlorin ferrochelatase n=1 Tax=Rothia sp. LK2588 TaxID=3114369 RepID=UPI0034CED9A9